MSGITAASASLQDMHRENSGFVSIVGVIIT
jgi:hypothetical protein